MKYKRYRDLEPQDQIAQGFAASILALIAAAVIAIAIKP